MICNINNDKETSNMNDAHELMRQGAYLLDVREPFEYEMGHISSAKNIPLGELESRLQNCLKIRRYTSIANVEHAVNRRRIY